MISLVVSEPYDGVNVIKSLKRLGELRAGGAGAMIHSGAGEKTKRAALSKNLQTSGLWCGLQEVRLLRNTARVHNWQKRTYQLIKIVPFMVTS